MENWILSRNLYKSVYHVCDSRKERISFLSIPDNKRDTSILENHSQGLPHRNRRQPPIDLETSGAPNESPESECSPGRADQLYNGVCSIEQRQHGRHHEQEKSRGLDREVLMRFAREVILGESMERRFAILYRSATDIVERRCLVIKVRLGEPTTHARSVRARSISMINLEYRFHANSSEFKPLVSGL
jgi:hypothetical protein